MAQDLTKFAESVTEAVTKLTQLTQSGELKWRSVPDEDRNVQNIQHLSGPVYLTEYKNYRLRLYKIKFQTTEPTILERMFNKERTTPRWVESMTLELIDEQDVSKGKFPFTTALKDLYAAVQQKNSTLEQFLSDILAD
jgi:hypothetical protein